MALLHHHMPHSDFGSLFRLLDDYDAHRSGATTTGTSGTSTAAATFSPRFDVREAKDAYMLDGDLPGIEQKDINIEFTDAHTLVINGRTERSYSVGTGKGTGKGKQATVEDEDEGEGRKGAGAGKGADDGGGDDGGGGKYWVSERSVGEFQRSFNFPTRVDQDAVKASLKHGVLSVRVPKATTSQTKRIRVE